VRLNVGWVECLILRAEGLRILIEKESAPTGTNFDGVIYPRAPGCDITTLPLSELPRALASFAESHSAALSIAARRPRSRNIMKAHSPGVIAFLSQALGRKIPNPSIASSVVADDLKTQQQVQMWRQAHPDGLIVNRKGATSGMLHRAECAHFGGYE
jgi:hypothetical protein